MRFYIVNSTIISEEELRELFISSFLKNEYLYKEVPVFSRSVDLVHYDDTNNTITAIEFKMGNWKKAIQQALTVSMCFDYIAICIPEPKTKKCLKAIEEECLKHGVGIYLFNFKNLSFKHFCFESRVGNVWEKQKISVINYLEVINNEEKSNQVIAL